MVSQKIFLNFLRLRDIIYVLEESYVAAVGFGTESFVEKILMLAVWRGPYSYIYYNVN